MLCTRIVFRRSKLEYLVWTSCPSTTKVVGYGNAYHSSDSCRGEQTEVKGQLEDSSVYDSRQKEQNGYWSSFQCRFEDRGAHIALDSAGSGVGVECGLLIVIITLNSIHFLMTASRRNADKDDNESNK